MILEVITYLAEKLYNLREPWALVGGSNLFLRKCIDKTNDVDIISTETGVSLIYKKLYCHTIIEPNWSEYENIRSLFYSACIYDIRIEVMGEPINHFDGQWVKNCWWKNSIESLQFEDLIVPCTSLYYEKMINIRLKNYDRALSIENFKKYPQ